ncbi:MAG: right-handed parallel beta-helix repeat-containing protein [Myxococcota bacterium]|nr:right-handed parallel beta-helix repeat-containing protein [Myxococcota bacterium]
MHYTLSVPLLLALLLACSTDTEPVTCAEGELLDGDACVPEACGTGTWGDLETNGDTLYVDASAEAGGDGSKESPFTVIQEGLDAQEERAMVAVAAGTYVENLQMTGDHSGLHLAGRCRELVVIDGSEGSQDDYETGCGIFLDAFGITDSWAVSGVTVTGAPWDGIYQYLGTLTVDRVRLLENGARGLTLEFGTLLATDCLVQGNHELGVFLGGASATFERVQVMDTWDEWGRGIQVIDGSTLIATDCLVQGNQDGGVFADASDLCDDAVWVGRQMCRHCACGTVLAACEHVVDVPDSRHSGSAMLFPDALPWQEAYIVKGDFV